MAVQFSLLNMKDQNFRENAAGILICESFECDFHVWDSGICITVWPWKCVCSKSSFNVGATFLKITKNGCWKFCQQPVRVISIQVYSVLIRSLDLKIWQHDKTSLHGAALNRACMYLKHKHLMSPLVSFDLLCTFHC